MSFVLSTISPIWKVLLIGLVLGAGLPALFALGMRSLTAGDTGSGPTVVGRTGAVLCFGLVILAVAFGIAVLVGGKHFLGLFGLS